MKAVAALCVLLATSAAASAATVTAPAGTSPESITAAPDGTLILGSSSKPAIFRAAKGESVAKPWIDLSADGMVTVLGVLADASSNTLWACEVGPRTVPGGAAFSALAGFDLTSGAPKSHWKLPGDASLCNDIAIGPDHAAYVSDTYNGAVLRAAPGANSGEVLLKHRALGAIDGLAFVNGVLFVNSVGSYTIWRIPIDASGKAGDPVNIWTDAPIKSPDGMRAANGRLFIGENSLGRVSMLHSQGRHRACDGVAKRFQDAHRHRAGGCCALGRRPRRRHAHIDSHAALTRGKLRARVQEEQLHGAGKRARPSRLCHWALAAPAPWDRCQRPPQKAVRSQDRCPCSFPSPGS